MTAHLEKTKWVRLGEYIEQCDEINSDNKIKIVKSVSIFKEFRDTGAKVNKNELSKYKIVHQGMLSYVQTTKNEKCFACCVNHFEEPIVVTPVNKVIKSKDSEVLDIDYLFLFLNRKEFDRYAIFNSWGSAREVFQWEDFKAVRIPLPDIEVQRELVASYNGLKALAEHNEALVKQLSAACHAYIVDCRAKYPRVPLGEYIEVYDKRNMEGKPYPFYGINKDKTFMPTVADTNELDNTKYKVVEKDVFVFSGMQTGRDVCIRIALFNKDNPIVISPAYTTFKIKNINELLPAYLFLQFNRKESDRYGWFLSDGSIRSNLDWERFCDIRIPLPPIEVQRAIVELYLCAERAKKIASDARQRLRTLCPALIQRAANS